MDLLSDIVTKVADDSKIDSNRSGVSARIKREINRVCQEIWDGYGWSFRQRSYRIATEIDEETGTVTATNGSRTITGAGTSFAAKHATNPGWHIFFPEDSVGNWYRVKKFTSSTSIELDVPYQGTTGSAKTFILRKFDYLFPTEIFDISSLSATYDRRPLEIYNANSLNKIIPSPFYKGGVHGISIVQSDSIPTTYTTGTVTGTINTSTITGSGTAWLSNVQPGDQFSDGTYDYTVREINSDTELIIYQKLAVALSASTYTITRQFGRIVRIMWPSSEAFVIEINGFRKYPPLVNDSDTNELLYRYPNVVIKKTAAMELKSQDDKKAGSLETEARIDLQEAKNEDKLLTNRRQVSPIHSYRLNRRTSEWR